ncbi:MAG: hypothetical protein IMF01_09550 [Proteobacteria bacterium]|nr:hypothetical protein [Pseudomonadota bacterium]
MISLTMTNTVNDHCITFGLGFSIFQTKGRLSLMLKLITLVVEITWYGRREL